MEKIEITNGPSREEMFDGLRLFSEKRLVPFIIEKNNMERWVAVIVNSIQAEDESGHSWNLTLFIGKKFISEDFFVSKPEKKEEGVISKKVDFAFFRQLCEDDYLVEAFKKNLVKVKAYYSTKTRKGYISFQKIYPDGSLKIVGISTSGYFTTLSLGEKIVFSNFGGAVTTEPLCSVVVATSDKYKIGTILDKIPDDAVPVDQFYSK
ncbi:MAG: hypothetical protein WCI93_04170 [bacterium]